MCRTPHNLAAASSHYSTPPRGGHGTIFGRPPGAGCRQTSQTPGQRHSRSWTCSKSCADADGFMNSSACCFQCYMHECMTHEVGNSRASGAGCSSAIVMVAWRRWQKLARILTMVRVVLESNPVDTSSANRTSLGLQGEGIAPGQDHTLFMKVTAFPNGH